MTWNERNSVPTNGTRLAFDGWSRMISPIGWWTVRFSMWKFQKSLPTMVPPWCQVILGTNIAESSVTIGDVEVVIDSGLSRGRQWVFHEPTQWTSFRIRYHHVFMILLMYHIMIYTCSYHDISIFPGIFYGTSPFLTDLGEATGVDLRPQTSSVVPGHRLGLAERRRATPRPRGARAPRAAAALLGLDVGVWGDCLIHGHWITGDSNHVWMIMIHVWMCRMIWKYMYIYIWKINWSWSLWST